MTIVAKVKKAKDGRLILETPGMSGLLKDRGYKPGDRVEIRRHTVKKARKPAETPVRQDEQSERPDLQAVTG